MTKRNSTSWRQGFLAGQRGKTTKDNPYDKGYMHDQWNKGCAAAAKTKGKTRWV